MNTPVNSEAGQDKAPLSADMHTFLQELMQTHLLLQDAVPQEKNVLQEDSGLLVARFIRGMDEKTWQELLPDLSALGWCAIKMGVTPAMSCICNPLMSAASPETAPHDLTEHLGLALPIAPFIQQLEQEVERATRGESPLALVFFALDFERFPHNTLAQKAPQALTDAVQHHTRPCDSLGILTTERFALILPGAGLFKAQALVENILQSYTEKYASIPLTVGIAGNTGKACLCSTLLEQANLALQEAIQKKMSLRVYREATQHLQHQRTLVQAHEKRFLFGGE